MATYQGRLRRLFRLQVKEAQRRAGIKPSIARFLETTTALYDLYTIEEYVDCIMAAHDGESLPEDQLGKQWTISILPQLSHGGTLQDIANPDNWSIKWKVREKAAQLTGELANDVTLSQIKDTINGLAGKLLVPKPGARCDMVAISKLIALYNPDITWRRCNKALKHLLERSGHSIVLTKGRYYLCDYALLPYPITYNPP